MPARKPDEEKLSEIIRVRFRKSELEAIKGDAPLWGMTPSMYIRSLATGQRPTRVPVPVIDRKTYAELGRIGTNLNQMARSLNQAHGVYSNEAEFENMIQELRTQISEIRLALLTAR